MPYSNIVFVKLFLSLFEEDDRFLYQLNESQQLLYIKMLYMAGSTNNRIVKNPRFICNKINYHHEEACFLSDIDRIKEVFPHGFYEKEGCYYFKNFNELHNYLGKSKGKPETEKGISQNKRRIRIDKEKNKKPPTDQEFLQTLKQNEAYKHINIDIELAKMDAWLMTHKGRQKTLRFIVNWLNKIDRPINTKPTPRPQIRADHEKQKPHDPKVAAMIRKTAEAMK